MRFLGFGHPAPLFPFEVARLLNTAGNGNTSPGNSTPRIRIPYFTGRLAVDSMEAWNEQHGPEHAVIADVIPPRIVVVHGDEVYAASDSADNEDAKAKTLARLQRRLEGLAKKQRNNVYTVDPTAMNQLSICTGEDHKKRLMLHFGDATDPVAGELAEERQAALEILGQEDFSPSEVRNPGLLICELTPAVVTKGLASTVLYYAQQFMEAKMTAATQPGATPLQPFRIMSPTIRPAYIE